MEKQITIWDYIQKIESEIKNNKEVLTILKTLYELYEKVGIDIEITELGINYVRYNLYVTDDTIAILEDNTIQEYDYNTRELKSTLGGIN